MSEIYGSGEGELTVVRGKRCFDLLKKKTERSAPSNRCYSNVLWLYTISSMFLITGCGIWQTVSGQLELELN